MSEETNITQDTAPAATTATGATTDAVQNKEADIPNTPEGEELKGLASVDSKEGDAENAETTTEGGDKEEKETSDTESKNIDDYEFVVPEEFKDVVDKDVLEQETTKIREFAKEHNLTDKAAQKLLDNAFAEESSAAQAQEKALNDLYNSWEQGCKSDTEFGGKDLQRNIGIGAKALKKFGSEDLTSYLKESKLEKHPEMVRFFYRVGKAMSEGDVLIGGNTQPVTKTAAQRIFSQGSD